MRSWRRPAQCRPCPQASQKPRIEHRLEHGVGEPGIKIRGTERLGMDILVKQDGAHIKQVEQKAQSCSQIGPTSREHPGHEGRGRGGHRYRHEYDRIDEPGKIHGHQTPDAHWGGWESQARPKAP